MSSKRGGGGGGGGGGSFRGRSPSVASRGRTPGGYQQPQPQRQQRQQPTQGQGDEALKRMTRLTNSLLARADAGPFRDPVDWRGLELFDYPKIIKKMMDLGTVKKKLERGQYTNAAECASDIRLIWTNCKTYNMVGSDFYLLAESFSKRFEDRYKKICNEYDTGEDALSAATSKSSAASAPAKSAGGGASRSHSPAPTGPISLDVKVNLAAKIFRLSGMELARAMNIIELRCPTALEGVGNGGGGGGGNSVMEDGVRTDEIEINIDKLDNRTFVELKKYVLEALSNGGRNIVEDDDEEEEEEEAPGVAAIASDEYEEEGVAAIASDEYEEEEEDEMLVEVQDEYEEEEEPEVITKRTTKKRRRASRD